MSASSGFDWVADWVLRDVLGCDGFEWSACDGDLRIHHAGRTLTMPNSFLGRLADGCPLPSVPLRVWDGAGLSEPLPLLFGEQGFWLNEDGNGRLGLDVFGSAFFMLSRIEEVAALERDAHDRFPASASLAARGGFLRRPLVDEYIEVLWAAMQRVWPGLNRRERTHQTVVSHDVDSPSEWAFQSWPRVLRNAAGDLVRRVRPRAALRRIARRAAGRRALAVDDPYNTFDWLMGASERRGVRSAFYFICGRTDARYDAGYDLGHPAIDALMRRIHARGHEIGLHPSYGTYLDSDAIAAEADALRACCARLGIEQAEWGGRMHYLRWRTPATAYGWEQAGMTYDATLGYPNAAGFRCGTCREYRAFDPIAMRPIGIRVRPLIAMEAAVLNGARDIGDAHDAFMQLKRACAAVGGNFNLLWHNNRFDSPAHRELYESLL